MVEAWFNVGYSWIPGTMLGVIGGLQGSLIGLFASKGKHKKLLLNLHYFLMSCCAGLLIAGIVAYFSGQPYGVWYALGHPGILGTIILGSLLPMILKFYKDAELRKSLAKDL